VHSGRTGPGLPLLAREAISVALLVVGGLVALRSVGHLRREGPDGPARPRARGRGMDRRHRGGPLAEDEPEPNRRGAPTAQPWRSPCWSPATPSSGCSSCFGSNTYGTVVVTATKPSRCRIGRLSSDAST